MVSLLLMRRCLCRCCDGVVALVTMASLLLPMCRRLAIVNDDGDGMTGDKDDDDVDNDAATGNYDNNN